MNRHDRRAAAFGYQLSMARAGAMRIDLNGIEVEPVNEQDAASAVTQLDRRAARKARQAAVAVQPVPAPTSSPMDAPAPAQASPVVAPAIVPAATAIAASGQITTPAAPKRIGLADLRAAAHARREREQQINTGEAA